MKCFRVKNLERYQHYKDRNPPWVKLHRTFLSDYELRQLPVPCRLFFMCSILIASEVENNVPMDLDYVSQRCGFVVDEAILTPLIKRGLLLAPKASSMLAPILYSDSSLSVSSLKKNEVRKGDLNLVVALKGKRPFPADLTLATVKPDDPTGSGWAKFGINPAVEFATFRDHALSCDRRCTDWKAAWRNWARKAIVRKEARP